MRRRRGRISLRGSPAISCPSNFTLPLVGWINCRMQRPAVVLPQPLSPTRPSTSPGCTSNEIPSMALTWPTVRENSPLWMGKYFFRSRTSRIGALDIGRYRVQRAGRNLAGAQATREMSRLDLDQIGIGEAAVLRDRTARMKTAADRKFRRVRDRAWNHAQAVLRGAEFWQRGLETGGVGMQRPAEGRSHIAVFDDPAGVHHRDMIRGLRHDAEVVRDEDDGHAHLPLQPSQ